jgi:hypothetical protein
VTTSERLARWTFAGLEVVALVYFLVVGRHLWFMGDEWDFLAHRSLNIHDLLAQHGGHLVALPLVVYRLLFAVFGLRSYLPYQLLAIVVHLTAAGLLRAVMRRAGAGPWIATAAATLFLFFGAGAQNILWAFQITFTAALAFGLAQLLLADHDGALDRRDWLGLAAGLGAITCSGVGVTMIGVVGVAALIRRGWRVALFHTAPLLGLWLIWRDRYASNSPSTTNPTQLFRWFRRGLAAGFDAMGQLPLVGWALAAVLTIGLVFAWRSLPRDGRRRAAAIPVACLAGVAAFLVTTGISRLWAGVMFAASSRYLYVVAALLLVPLAVAADALARWKRALAPVVILLLLVGIPDNLSRTTTHFYPPTYYSRQRQALLSVARLPLAARVPRSLRPDPSGAPPVTIGWLLDGVRSGRLPSAQPSTPRDRVTNILRLSLEQLDRSDGRKCRPLSGPTDRILRAGRSLVVHGAVAVQLSPHDSPRSAFLPFGTTVFDRQDHTLVAVAQPLALRIVPRSTGAGAC